MSYGLLTILSVAFGAISATLGRYCYDCYALHKINKEFDELAKALDRDILLTKEGRIAETETPEEHAEKLEDLLRRYDEQHRKLYWN